MSGGMSTETHKLAPPNVVIVPQILPEVKVIHKLENKSQWMLGGGVHSDKWHEVPVLEATTRQCFLIEPLPMNLQ